MKELIQISGTGELFTTSLIIAEGVGISHKNVMELIRKNIEDLQEFGQLAFQTRVVSKHGAGQKTEYATLNEPQTTFLLTLMRNTARVKEFKKVLVKEFFRMAALLKSGSFSIQRILLRKPREYEPVFSQAFFYAACGLHNLPWDGVGSPPYGQVASVIRCRVYKPTLTAEGFREMKARAFADECYHQYLTDESKNAVQERIVVVTRIAQGFRGQYWDFAKVMDQIDRSNSLQSDMFHRGHQRKIDKQKSNVVQMSLVGSGA